MSVDTTFISWLYAEIEKRDLSLRQLGRMAGVSAVAISNVLNENRKPGIRLCRGLARAFQIPPEDVLRRAGLLPPAPPESASLNEALFLFRQLHPDTQDQVLAMLRGLVEHYVAKKEGPPPRPQ